MQKKLKRLYQNDALQRMRINRKMRRNKNSDAEFHYTVYVYQSLACPKVQYM